jgi:hypothetical protein
MTSNLVLIFCAILTGIATFFVTRWSMRKDAEQKNYSHIDSLYADILAQYLLYPQFQDSARTEHFTESFQGEDGLRYRAFAAVVHNFLESIFDLRYDKEKESVGDQWRRVFEYHARLHSKWLLANKTLFEPAYVAFALKQVGPDEAQQ